jgi:membrane protease YdiL (CAAX protease family)
MQPGESPNPLPSLPVNPPLPAPWGIRDLVLAILTAAAGILVLNLLLAGIALVTGDALAKQGNLLTVFVVIQDLIILVAAALFSVARYHVGWDRLGLRAFHAPLGCGLSVALLMGSYAVRICYGLFAVALGYRPALQDVLLRLDTQGIGLVLTLIAAAVVAPLVEEIFFRGFLYGGLRGRIGVAGAMLVSTLFFTALHFSIDQFVPIFFLGLFLAWLYEKTGSLYPGMFLHMANNAISLVLFALLKAVGGLPGL